MANNSIQTTIPEDALDDLHGRYLTFYIGDNIYGIELFHIIEIISVQPITVIPNVPNYIKGITNLRGKVIPVIDVRLKFNMEEREYDEKTCIIIVTYNDMSIGLIVDSVAEVETIDKDGSSLPPELGSASEENYLQSIAKIGDNIILNIDCEKFFSGDLY